MTGSVILDVVIGLVFVYLLYSLLATIVQEIIATQLSFRAKVLEKAILRMLEDGKSTTASPIMDRVQGFLHMLGKFNWLKNKKIATSFYAHPLIKYLAEDNWFSKPAYISAKNFSKVIVDLLHGFDATGKIDIAKIDASIRNGTINKLPPGIGADQENPANAALAGQQAGPSNTEIINPETTLFLRTLWRDAGNDLENFKTKLEQWFDDTMERATGWYKKYTQVILFVVGLSIAVIFNIDTISLVKNLSRDPKLRDQLAENANSFLQKNQDLRSQIELMKNAGDDTSFVYQQTVEAYDSINARSNRLVNSASKLINSDINNTNKLLFIGWAHQRVHFLTVIGWIITALAISLGAPFWFDLLNKLMMLKGSGVNPAEKPQKKNK